MKPFFLKLLQFRTRSVTQEGLTLVEAVVAMVISTIVLTAMAPPLLFSAATRVQTRKVEQAQAFARQELDRVRAALTRKQGIAQTKETGTLPPQSSTSPLSDTPPPNTVVASYSELDSPAKAFKADIDLDGEDDVLVQLIRDQGIRFGSGAAKDELAAFEMGIRVYDVAAAKHLDKLSDPPKPASLQMTKGLGERLTNPLAVMYTEVSRSDLRLSLQEYREYICQVKPSKCPSD